jgi:hypothetical protein
VSPLIVKLWGAAQVASWRALAARTGSMYAANMIDDG